MAQNILIRRPADMTVAWAQRIVDQQAADITVSAVNVLSVDIGTTTRVRVEVTHDGPADFPHHWFIKLPSLSWKARLITALPRLLQTEIYFYQEMAAEVPVTCPTVLAAQSRFGQGATLVLADVETSGAHPGAPGDSLSVTQATMVVEQLARLHACFWNRSALEQQYQRLGGPVRRLENRLGTILAVPLMQRGLQRAGSVVPIRLHQPAIHYARQRRRAMRLLAEGPPTLVHHDCHPGNLFWHRAQPGFFDWQMVRIGEGIGDIAYFLATALEPEVRRMHEMELLAHYRQIIADQGVAIADITRLFQRYRAHLVYPFEAMLVTLAIGDMMDRESNTELIRRATAAIEDLDVFTIPAFGIPCS